MKLIIMSCFLLSTLAGRTQEISGLRALYLRAGNDESACRQLLGTTRSPVGPTHAVMLGYSGVATMMMARFVFNPISKLSWFRQGREMLDKAILMDGTAPELRYLRYCVQRHCPRILGYYQEVAADREYLLCVVDGESDEELKSMIAQALKNDPAAGWRERGTAIGKER